MPSINQISAKTQALAQQIAKDTTVPQPALTRPLALTWSVNTQNYKLPEYYACDPSLQQMKDVTPYYLSLIEDSLAKWTQATDGDITFEKTDGPAEITFATCGNIIAERKAGGMNYRITEENELLRKTLYLVTGLLSGKLAQPRSGTIICLPENDHSLSRADAKRVIAHEIGHTFGLDHIPPALSGQVIELIEDTKCKASVMAYETIYNCNDHYLPDTPGELDLATLDVIMPRRSEILSRIGHDLLTSTSFQLGFAKGVFKSLNPPSVQFKNEMALAIALTLMMNRENHLAISLLITRFAPNNANVALQLINISTSIGYPILKLGYHWYRNETNEFIQAGETVLLKVRDMLSSQVCFMVGESLAKKLVSYIGKGGSFLSRSFAGGLFWGRNNKAKQEPPPDLEEEKFRAMNQV